MVDEKIRHAELFLEADYQKSKEFQAALAIGKGFH